MRPVPAFDRAGPRSVADGVVVTRGGQVVLAGGEAVIDRDDTVLTGTSVIDDRVTVITTSYGDFRLLPTGLLLTPDGTLVDLHEMRGDLAPAGPDTGTATTDTTAGG